MNIKFIEYEGIEGYIELMKHDVEPLNDPECKSLELYYNGKDIKAVLDLITNLQDKNEKLNNIIREVREYIEKVETFALVDKKIIFSMSTLKEILDKGSE